MAYLSAEETVDFRKRWRKIVAELKNSGYDLSRIKLVKDGEEK